MNVKLNLCLGIGINSHIKTILENLLIIDSREMRFSLEI